MQTSTEQLALIKQLNVIDDVFFHKIAEDKAVCEEILRIILQKPKLKVLDAQAQRFLRNISAHSVILDLLCEDEDGSRINVEMQKADDDDHVKRVRFNSSNIDTTFTEKGLDYKDFNSTCFRKERLFTMQVYSYMKQEQLSMMAFIVFL